MSHKSSMSSVKRENSGCYFTKALNAKCNVTQYILDLDRLYTANYHLCQKGYNSDHCNKKK